MKKNDLITVIVPAFNEENRIKTCLDSIVNQTYSNIEVIVIDDGSTDNTVKEAKSIKDERIKVLSVENGGQGKARNLGIKQAKGKFLTFVDSDDYIDKTMIEKLYSCLKNNKSDISICNIIKRFDDYDLKFKNYNNYTDDSRVNYMISHSGPVARLYNKELFEKNDVYFLENCIYEDLALVPTLGLYTKKISYVDDYLYFYIIRKESSMHQKVYNEKLNDIFKILEYLTNKFDNKDQEILELIYVEHLLYSANLRFLCFEEGKEKLKFIASLMNKKYPNWYKNPLLKHKSYKFKIFCFFAYHNVYLVCKVINKIFGGRI